MAGTADVTSAPYPMGRYFMVRLGGHVPQGLAAQVVDTWVLPFDCKVRFVYRSYAKDVGGQDLDAITLKTVDATALTIVASLNASADIAGVKQTLHSDIKGTNLVKGNKIQLTADSSAGTEAGYICDTLLLEPTYG